MNLWNTLKHIFYYYPSICLFPFGVSKESGAAQHNLDWSLWFHSPCFEKPSYFEYSQFVLLSLPNISFLWYFQNNALNYQGTVLQEEHLYPEAVFHHTNFWFESQIFWTPYYYYNRLQQQYTLLLIWNWCSFQKWATQRLFVERYKLRKYLGKKINDQWN